MLPETLDGLILYEVPPEGRRGATTDGTEHKMPEAAVMLAYAFHLMRRGASYVTVSPDGMHLKQFDMRGWLERHGFVLVQAEGGNPQSGVYQSGERTIRVHPHPGVGDVRAEVGDGTVTAECKPGVINSTHSGVASKLRMGLFSAIGQALYLEETEGGRHVAVMPRTPQVETSARRIAPRLARLGVEIDLVEADGRIIEIRPRLPTPDCPPLTDHT